jgi:hypothetical protein
MGNLVERRPGAGRVDSTEQTLEKKAMTSSCKRGTGSTNERTRKRSRCNTKPNSEDVDFPVQTLLRMVRYGKTAVVTASTAAEPYSAHCKRMRHA